MRRAAIAAAARSWIGTPYHHGASLKGVGCDCLGLLRGVWREVVGPEPERPPPYAPDWAEAAGQDRLLAAALRHLRSVDPAGPWRAGDVVLFRWRAFLPAKHCAVLTGPIGMVHAHEGAAVTEVALAPWWSRHVAGRFAFPGAEP